MNESVAVLDVTFLCFSIVLFAVVFFIILKPTGLKNKKQSKKHGDLLVSASIEEMMIDFAVKKAKIKGIQIPEKFMFSINTLPSNTMKINIYEKSKTTNKQ